MNHTNPVVAFFASELRRARQAAGLTQDQLATTISYSASLVAQVETGRKTPSRDFAQRCDDALKTGGLLARIIEDLLSKEVAPEWFRPWLVVEQEATHIRYYEPLLIPGLLQTEEYAGALLGDAERTAFRMERQRVLDRASVTVVVAESVLSYLVGSPEVMHQQLKALVESPATVQVLPTDAATHLGTLGSFAIATVDGSEVAYADSPVRGLVTSDPAVVSDVRRRWDGLRGEALPQRQSRELIMKVAVERWKS